MIRSVHNTSFSFMPEFFLVRIKHPQIVLFMAIFNFVCFISFLFPIPGNFHSFFSLFFRGKNIICI